MSSQAIARVREAARKTLLDTGTRNRPIHVNRANRRANCLNIINERADEVHGLLRVQSRKMRIKAMGKDKVGEDQEMLLALLEAEIPACSDGLTVQFLETPLGPEAPARRLLCLSVFFENGRVQIVLQTSEYFARQHGGA